MKLKNMLKSKFSIMSIIIIMSIMLFSTIAYSDYIGIGWNTQAGEYTTLPYYNVDIYADFENNPTGGDVDAFPITCDLDNDSIKEVINWDVDDHKILIYDATNDNGVNLKTEYTIVDADSINDVVCIDGSGVDNDGDNMLLVSYNQGATSDLKTYKLSNDVLSINSVVFNGLNSTLYGTHHAMECQAYLDETICFLTPEKDNLEFSVLAVHFDFSLGTNNYFPISIIDGGTIRYHEPSKTFNLPNGRNPTFNPSVSFDLYDDVIYMYEKSASRYTWGDISTCDWGGTAKCNVSDSDGTAERINVAVDSIETGGIFQKSYIKNNYCILTEDITGGPTYYPSYIRVYCYDKSSLEASYTLDATTYGFSPAYYNPHFIGLDYNKDGFEDIVASYYLNGFTTIGTIDIKNGVVNAKEYNLSNNLEYGGVTWSVWYDNAHVLVSSKEQFYFFNISTSGIPTLWFNKTMSYGGFAIFDDVTNDANIDIIYQSDVDSGVILTVPSTGVDTITITQNGDYFGLVGFYDRNCVNEDLVISARECIGVSSDNCNYINEDSATRLERLCTDCGNFGQYHCGDYSSVNPFVVCGAGNFTVSGTQDVNVFMETVINTNYPAVNFGTLYFVYDTVSCGANETNNTITYTWGSTPIDEEEEEEEEVFPSPSDVEGTVSFLVNKVTGGNAFLKLLIGFAVTIGGMLGTIVLGYYYKVPASPLIALLIGGMLFTMMTLLTFIPIIIFIATALFLILIIIVYIIIAVR